MIARDSSPRWRHSSGPKKRRLVTEQAKIEDRYRQFVESRTRMILGLLSVPSKGSDRPPTNISDDNINLPGYSIKQSQSGY